MRQIFTKAYEDIDNLQNHKQIITTAPVSAQQKFLQVLVNINLCNRKQAIGQIVPLLNNYKGSFSQQILTLKYCTYCMETDKNKTYNVFNVLKLLSKWVITLQTIKKKKDLRLCEAIVDNLETGICTYQEFIVFQNYIGNDVMALIKSGTEESRKKYPDFSKHPHLDPADLTKFLSIALPKVLINMIVPRNFFPPTLLRSTDQNIDILYSNQNYENIAQNKPHYNSLIRTIFKSLFIMQLEPSQVKQLVLSSFKYFYLFHYDKSYSASQFVIESLKKMSSAVRFAISDQISLFITVLNKLGKQLFVSYLTQKFSWISQIIKSKTVIGVNKSTIKPFGNQNFGNSLKIKIQAGKIDYYYMEVYDRFSLIYFCIKCLQHDISIRFYYLGDFKKQEGVDDRKLLISSEKKQGVFEGSLQIIQKGIYMFQFDNSYAWMKAKTLTFDLSIYVPIQIKQHAKNKIKQLVFQKNQHLNEVPFENVIGWVDDNEIRLNSTSANISSFMDGTVKVYNVKLLRNTGQAYEYQTQSKYRFLKKLKVIEKDPNLFWLIDGYKVKGVQDIEKWLQGDYQLEKLHGKFRQDQSNDDLQEEISGQEQEQQQKKQLKQISKKFAQQPQQQVEPEIKQPNTNQKQTQHVQNKVEKEDQEKVSENQQTTEAHLQIKKQLEEKQAQ